MADMQQLADALIRGDRNTVVELTTQALAPLPVIGETITLLVFATAIALVIESRSSPGSLQPSGMLPLHGPSSLMGTMMRMEPSVQGKRSATIAVAGPHDSSGAEPPGNTQSPGSPGTVSPSRFTT